MDLKEARASLIKFRSNLAEVFNHADALTIDRALANRFYFQARDDIKNYLNDEGAKQRLLDVLEEHRKRNGTDFLSAQLRPLAEIITEAIEILDYKLVRHELEQAKDRIAQLNENVKQLTDQNHELANHLEHKDKTVQQLEHQLLAKENDCKQLHDSNLEQRKINEALTQATPIQAENLEAINDYKLYKILVHILGPFIVMLIYTAVLLIADTPPDVKKLVAVFLGSIAVSYFAYKRGKEYVSIIVAVITAVYALL